MIAATVVQVAEMTGPHRRCAGPELALSEAVRTAVKLASSALLASFAVHAAPAAADNPACRPPTVMVVLDKSSSMRTGTIGGVTKWTIAVSALSQVMAQIQDHANVGLMTFPRPNECGPGGLDVAPALNNRQAIQNALATPPPTSGFYTPMAQTLEVAALEPTLINAPAPRFVVVITDGWQWCSPYDPATRFDGVDAIGSLNGAGVTTYVVGFGGAVDAQALNRMAVASGTDLPGCNPANTDPASAHQCYYQADNSATLVAALQQIAAHVAVETCDGLDNDCDGLIDEDLVRDCASACGSGTETCSAGAWGSCTAPAVEHEACNGVDDDCDGIVDPGCDCVIGTTRTCGEPSDVGACQPGVQTCGADGTWGSCANSVGAIAEMCNGVDDDCDGVVDNGASVLGCQTDEVCNAGNCQPAAPVTPPDDETDPNGGDGVPGGCGCSTDGGQGGAAGGLLLALGVAFAVRRRRSSAS